MEGQLGQNSPMIDEWGKMATQPGVSESGGEETNEGVDFARYWAMSALIDLEKSGAPDYVLVFEFLQDITVLDSHTCPTSAVLYQVKKKEKGQWALSHLCATAKKSKASKGAKSGKALKGRSPLGKLYLSLESALSGVQDAKGVFLSNASCNLKVSTGGAIPSYRRVPLAGLDKAHRDSIQKKLAKELKKDGTLTHLDAIYLEQTNINPAAMRYTLRGIVSEFLEQSHPEIPMVPGRLIECLIHSFSSVSGRQDGCYCLADVVKKKGFTRQQFTAILTDIAQYRTQTEKGEEILHALKYEGLPSRVADRARKEMLRLHTQRVRDPAVLQPLKWDVCIAAAKDNKHLDEYSTLVSDIMAKVRSEIHKQGGLNPDDDTLRALAILAIIQVDEEPTPPDSKHPDQTK